MHSLETIKSREAKRTSQEKRKAMIMERGAHISQGDPKDPVFAAKRIRDWVMLVPGDTFFDEEGNALYTELHTVLERLDELEADVAKLMGALKGSVKTMHGMFDGMLDEPDTERNFCQTLETLIAEMEERT